VVETSHINVGFAELLKVDNLLKRQGRIDPLTITYLCSVSKIELELDLLNFLRAGAVVTVYTNLDLLAKSISRLVKDDLERGRLLPLTEDPTVDVFGHCQTGVVRHCDQRVLIQENLVASGQSYLAVNSCQISPQEMCKSELVLRVCEEEAGSKVFRDPEPEPEAVLARHLIFRRELCDNDARCTRLGDCVVACAIERTEVEGFLFKQLQLKRTDVVDLAPNVELNDSRKILIDEGEWYTLPPPALFQIDQLGFAIDDDRHRVLACLVTHLLARTDLLIN